MNKPVIIKATPWKKNEKKKEGHYLIGSFPLVSLTATLFFLYIYFLKIFNFKPCLIVQTADNLIADEFSGELAEGVAYVAGQDEESRPVAVSI